MKGVAIFILGVLAGAVLTALTAGWQLDNAHLERKALQNKVIELQDTVKRLEEALADQEHREIRVEKVKVSLINPPDPFVALDIEEAALRLLSDLIGKDVANLDLRLVHNLVHERIIEVEGKRYKLLVQGLQLHRQTEVLLKANLLPSEDDEP